MNIVLSLYAEDDEEKCVIRFKKVSVDSSKWLMLYDIVGDKITKTYQKNL